MTDEERNIYIAWRDSEHNQVPMTQEGVDLAERRWRAFKKGWEAAQQYMDKGCIARGCACYDPRDNE